MTMTFRTTRRAALAGIGALAAAPLAWAFGAPWPYVAFIGLAALFVILKHRENIQRLLAGTENRIHLGGKGTPDPT